MHLRLEAANKTHVIGAVCFLIKAQIQISDREETKNWRENREKIVQYNNIRMNTLKSLILHHGGNFLGQRVRLLPTFSLLQCNPLVARNLFHGHK